MKRTVLLIIPGLLLFAATAGCSTPEQLLGQTHIFGSASRLSLEVTMTMYEDGTEQTREVEIKLERSSSHDGDLSLYAAVTAPPFLRNLRFLTVHRNGRDDKWMRTSRGVRRLSSGGGEERIFGSDFRAEDFSAVDVDALQPVLVSESGSSVVLRTSDDRIFTVNTETDLIEEIEYGDGSGTVKRRYRVLETMVVSGEVVPRKAEMVDLTDNRRTEIDVREAEVPASIPRRFFTYGNL